MIRATILCTMLFACILAAASAQAGIVVPSGLHSGDHYYLAFVTFDRRDATSSNIADYNQFVQNQAAQAPALTGTNEGVQWRAIASTPTVNASDNLGLLPGVPIYELNGTWLVVADAGSLLAIPFLETPILRDQFAQFNGAFVWTGTLPGGTTGGTTALGGASGKGVWALGEPEPFDPAYSWLDHNGEAPQSLLFSLYAISTILTVPEPTSLWLLLIGAGVLGLADLGRRMRQHRLAPRRPRLVN